MKDSCVLSAGKALFAGKFKIIPVIRKSAVITDTGGMCSAEPVGLILVSGEDYLKISLKNDDSWIEEFAGL